MRSTEDRRAAEGGSAWRGRLPYFLVLVAAGVVALQACSGDDGPSEARPDRPPEELSDPFEDSAGAGNPDNPLPELPSPVLPEEPLTYDTPLPDHLQVPVVELSDNTPEDNPITDDGGTLGRVLFYDRRLSQNGETSCSSCHVQSQGFTDSQVQSVGHTGETTRRHSMTLVNLRYRPGGRMFWDGRAVSVEDQALMPIQDEVEMGMTLEELTERLADTDYYPPLFEAAFGDAEITSERIAQAVAQFVRSIVSFETRFDEAVAEVGDVRGDFPGYTDQEQLGKEIFFGEGEHNQGLGGNCSTCHMYANPAGFLPPEGAPGAAPPGAPDPENTGFFFLIRPNNNGLLDPDDDGFGETTEAEADDGKFFVSSLRNVALTAPYMHDGRFATLEEVIDHYSEGVEPHPNLDPQLFDFSAAQPLTTPLQYGFTDEEKAAVIAYLGTLTDESVLTDERWSDPFGQ